MLPALALVCAVALPSPASAQQAWLQDWASQKQNDLQALAATPGFADPANDPVPLAVPLRRLRVASDAERAVQRATIARYEALIGSNTPASWLWTGIETANPLTRDENYRWNALRDQRLMDGGVRKTVIDQLLATGVTNIRLGLSNHEIDLDDEASWAEHDALIADFADAGLNISLDLHHFGVEDRFRAVGADGRAAPERSYYLNPSWPTYFARFAAAAYARYADRIKAVTIVNEPETTIGFNSEMWHGAFPGWGDPRHDRFYVERAFQVAKAAVKARTAIERQRSTTPRDLLFVHTEAVVYKPGADAFNRFVRFLPSDLILGQRWLLQADIDQLAGAPLGQLAAVALLKTDNARTSLDWLVDRYVLSVQGDAAQEKRRMRLADMLRELVALHRALEARTGKTMASETVFAADYYAHNEATGASGAKLSPEPQLYAEQIQSGERRGLYPLLVAYYNRYGLPMMVGETGTPFHHFGARWHQQMMLECATAMAQGVPMLGYTIYPLLDTWGWETALSVPKAQTLHNPAGMLDLDHAARPFVALLMDALNNRTASAATGAETTVQ